MNFDATLAGKKAVVTGGSNGIGKALVEKLKTSGADVVFSDVEEPSFSSDAHFIKADLTDNSQVDSFHKQAEEKIGSPDILVLNAGRGIEQALDAGNADQWQQIIQLNVMSTLRNINNFLPGMKKKGFADVVIISSVSSFKPYRGGAVYSATKAALDKIAEVLRIENMPEIRVTTLAPGVVNTQFFQNNIDGTNNVESLGMGAVEPEEIADAVLYAITRRQGISINYMVIRPTAQEM